MTLRNFLASNLENAERRLGRITAPVAALDDESRLWRTLEDSAAGRGLSTVARWLEQAGPHSRLLDALNARLAMWAAHGPFGRMRMVGIATLIAAVVHVALGATTHPVCGWWLIVPGVAAFFGAAAAALSWFGPPTRNGQP